MRTMIAVGGLVLLAGCGGSASPEPSFDTTTLPATITLGVGEQRTIRGVVIAVSEVRSDSRCPTDVTCVWAGNAEVAVSVGPAAGDGPVRLLALNTGIEPRAGAALGLTVTLVTLSPDPVSTAPTRDYRAELRIEATPGT